MRFLQRKLETTYCGMLPTIIHLRALDPQWSVFRNKKGVSPDRYNTKTWNCTPKLGGLYWFFLPKKFEATTSPQVGVQFLMSNECRVLMLRIWDNFSRSMTLMLPSANVMTFRLGLTYLTLTHMTYKSHNPKLNGCWDMIFALVTFGSVTGGRTDRQKAMHMCPLCMVGSKIVYRGKISGL